jgi:hypothetical protein
MCWDDFDSDILGFVEVEGDVLGLAEGKSDGDILGLIDGDVL